MFTFTYQPALRPALPCVYGPLDYREQRTLFERIDLILSASGLEQDFVNLALSDRKIDTSATSAKRLERFARFSVLNGVRVHGLTFRKFSGVSPRIATNEDLKENYRGTVL